GLGRLPEVGRVEARRALQELAEARPAPARILGRRVLALPRHLDAVAVPQGLDRLGEAEPLLLLDELDHVAPDSAPEAVVELLPRIDRERRRALLVERAQPRVPLPRPPQVRVGGDDLHDVRRLLDPLDR